MSLSNEEKIMNNLKTIEEWAIQGMSQKEMAELLGMGYSTFRKIKQQNVALLALLKKCANDRKKIEEEQVKSVEESLFKRATGYNYKKKVPIKVKKECFNEEGKKYTEEYVVETEVEEHVPADIQAAKFFLLNKAKKEWNNDPNKLEIDKENLKLRKKEIEGRDW